MSKFDSKYQRRGCDLLDEGVLERELEIIKHNNAKMIVCKKIIFKQLNCLVCLSVVLGFIL